MTLTLLRNGRIHTAADPDATAMAIDGSVISWIGGEHAIALAGDTGPGGRSRRRAGRPRVCRRACAQHRRRARADRARPVRDADRWPNASAPSGDFAAQHPDGVLWGHGWEETRWPENRPPTRAEFDAAVGNRADVPVQGRCAFGADQHARWPAGSPTVRRCPAGRTPVRSPGRPTTRSGPLRGNNSRTGSGSPRSWPSCGRRPRNGIVEVHECAQGDVTGRGDLAGLLALDGPVRVRGYLATADHRPGAGAASCWQQPARTRSAAI